MRLANAASYFDRTVCADAYTPASTFLGQLDLFDDSKRDGGTVARRVISVGPDVSIPARRAVTLHDETFILGGLHTDSFMGSVIRRKYVAHKADGLATIKTIDQTVRAQAGSTAYAARLWVKDMKEIEISSRLTGFFALFFAPGEDVDVGDVVSLDGRLYLVRQTITSAAGFLLAGADELPTDAFTSIEYTYNGGAAGVYNAATDKVTSAAAATVAALWHRFQSDFEYLQQGAEKLEEGDITIHVSKAALINAAAGDTFAHEGHTWRVLDVRDQGDNVWRLHARRGAAYTGFSVAGLATLAAWYPYNTGITSSGGAVSQWNDASGNARHYKQATAGARPTLQANGTILFDGTSDYLVTDAATINQPITRCILFKQISWTSNDYIADGRTANTASITQRNAGTSPEIRIQNGGGSSSSSPGLPLGTYGVAIAVFDGAGSLLQVNNEVPATCSLQVTGMGGFAIGTHGAGTNSWSNIQVVEEIIYAKALTAAERAQVVAYLREKAVANGIV